MILAMAKGAGSTRAEVLHGAVYTSLLRMQQLSQVPEA
jgi:hypothetical protein